MEEFIISCAVVLLAVVALFLAAKIRKKMDLSVFLCLIAFEVIVILAASWIGIIYGAMLEVEHI